VDSSIGDIREVSAEEYWQELRRKWGALLSYRYIGREFSSMNTAAKDTVTLRRDMRNQHGGVLAQILALCAPGGGQKSDLEAVPNPVIHSMQILDSARDVTRLTVVDAEVLKDGARMYFGRCRIVDADDPSRVIALIEGQGASIGDVPAGMGRFDDDASEPIVDSPDLPPIWQVFGASKRPDGHWGLGELREEFASPDAALHVGPQHVILETAALECAGEVVGTDRLQVLTTHTMHLARGKVGPFRVDTQAIPAQDGRIAVLLTLHDEGNEDRAVTAATYVLAPV
jgi:hypothetical protein